MGDLDIMYRVHWSHCYDNCCDDVSVSESACVQHHNKTQTHVVVRIKHTYTRSTHVCAVCMSVD